MFDNFFFTLLFFRYGETPSVTMIMFWCISKGQLALNFDIKIHHNFYSIAENFRNLFWNQRISLVNMFISNENKRRTVLTRTHKSTRPPTIHTIQRPASPPIQTFCIFYACWLKVITGPRRGKSLLIRARSFAIRIKYADYEKTRLKMITVAWGLLDNF